MKKSISRRDFLKLASLAPAAWMSTPLFRGLDQFSQQSNTLNILILIFDAWSAKDVSFYGHPRETMPNLEKFSERAIVYHNHYSAGTFTSPGAASILTGLYPWSHRAFQLGNLVIDIHREHQMFTSLKDNFSTTLGYSQNRFANRLLEQFETNIDVRVPLGAYNIYNRLSHDSPVFSNRVIESMVSAFESDASIFVGPMLRVRGLYNEQVINNEYLPDYPKGLPNAIESLFLLESVVARTIETLIPLNNPFLGYMHFFPPHEPYHPKTKFWGKFRDDWRPPDKGIHPLAVEKDDYEKAIQTRRLYDEFIASWDFELGRLFDFFDDSGLRENSYIIITSDHGEMFERGERGHSTPLMYDPLVHVPLIISCPGQQERKDVYVNTSNVDILPTLAQLTGSSQPAWTEGQVLPGLGGAEDTSRGVFT
ncbi:MAG: sulfatase-like hydrolase/transferase, partial [Anaerolineales bacterium]